MKRFFLALLSLMLVLIVYLSSITYYTGPPSDHFDGTHFFNPNEDIHRPFYKFIYWMLTRKPADWSKEVVEFKFDTPPSQVTDGLRISFVGHATLLIQVDGLNILTDPIWSERASPVTFVGPHRKNPPGIHFDDLPKIDIVAISHNHYDHMDKTTIEALYKRDDPYFIVSLGNDEIIKGFISSNKIIPLDWYESHTVEDLKVDVVPAVHWSGRFALDKNKALWNGFVISTSLGRLYFSGDTALGSAKAFHEIRNRYGEMLFSMIACGAYEPRWFMKSAHNNSEDSAALFTILGSKYGYGMHHATFQLSDESIHQQFGDFDSAINGYGLEGRFKLPKVGDYWYISSTSLGLL